MFHLRTFLWSLFLDPLGRTMWAPNAAHGVRGPHLNIYGRWIFAEKSPSGKNDQKWSKTLQKEGFGIFKENQAISFVWNWCKTKVLMVL